MEKKICTEGAPEAKKRKCRIISDHFYDPDFQKKFFSSWNADIPVKNEKLEIITKPFKVCKISNFFNDPDFLDQIKADLLNVPSTRQDIDLFEMEQTLDLSKEKGENFEKLSKVFKNDIADWIERNTAIHLDKKITMTGSCYTDTDYLICHDDRLNDRRVAFILYLSKDWSAEFGGTLDLFDTDEQGLPKNIVHSIVPEYNSLVFFEVTNNSYHQVSEILKSSKERWSINGWFHGLVPKSTEFKRPEEIISFIDPEMTKFDLSLWVSKLYLDPQTICDIQEEVENDSSALLKAFITDVKYKKLSEEIQGSSIKWKMVGPPDVRRYEVADEDSLPETLANFIQLIKSVTFCQYLKNLTELDLVPETEEMKPKLNFELQRWSHGCYTVLKDEKSADEDGIKDSNNGVEKESNESIPFEKHDELLQADSINQYTSDSDHEEPGKSEEYEEESKKGVLEVILQFHTENFKSQSIAYVDKTEEDGTILEIPYKDNHLSLVYITGTSQRLQKYMNHTVEGYTYCLICSYIE